MKTKSRKLLTWDEECPRHNPVPVGALLKEGDEFKRRRDKRWKPIPRSMVGRKQTKRHAMNSFFFRRPNK
jgi:hypothetical protein